MTFSESKGERKVRVLPFLVMEEQQLVLEIFLPSSRERMNALGRVIWSELETTEAAFHLKIGILLEEMVPQERDRWNMFIREVADLGT